MTSPLWLSHHHEHQADRCIRVGDAHVCRRCAVLYPGMLVVAAIQLAGWIPRDVGVALMWVMPLGVVGEWIAEHLLGAAYSASRQIVTTALASVSFGVALGRHVRNPFEAASTAPAVTFTLLCLVVWFIGARRHDPASTEWEAEFESAEEQRLDALLALLRDAVFSGSMQDAPFARRERLARLLVRTEDGVDEACTLLDRAFETADEAAAVATIMESALDTWPDQGTALSLFEKAAKRSGQTKLAVTALLRVGAFEKTRAPFEQAWLLAQEARTAAQKLRRGVGMNVPEETLTAAPVIIEEGSGGVESTLNRLDEARDKGIFINVAALSAALGVPVVPIVAPPVAEPSAQYLTSTDMGMPPFW